MNCVRWCYSGRGLKAADFRTFVLPLYQLDKCVYKTLCLSVAWMRCGVAHSPLHIPLDTEPLLFVISVFGDVAVLVILYRIGY